MSQILESLNPKIKQSIIEIACKIGDIDKDLLFHDAVYRLFFNREPNVRGIFLTEKEFFDFEMVYDLLTSDPEIKACLTEGTMSRHVSNL